jgi:hypothetical protein
MILFEYRQYEDRLIDSNTPNSYVIGPDHMFNKDQHAVLDHRVTTKP